MDDSLNSKDLVLFYKHQYIAQGDINEVWEPAKHSGVSQINKFYYDRVNNRILLENIESVYEDPGKMLTTTTTYIFDENVTLEHVVSLCCMQSQGANEKLKYFNSLLKQATVLSCITTEN